jgi:hypothetical protein
MYHLYVARKQRRNLDPRRKSRCCAAVRQQANAVVHGCQTGAQRILAGRHGHNRTGRAQWSCGNVVQRAIGPQRGTRRDGHDNRCDAHNVPNPADPDSAQDSLGGHLETFRQAARQICWMMMFDNANRKLPRPFHKAAIVNTAN